jgi:hypothetical protein
LVVEEEAAMAELSERHEVRVRGRNGTIVFLADSQDGRLVIRQEPDGHRAKDVCSITLTDPDELRAFFKGLRRILASLGHNIDVAEPTDARRDTPRALGAGRRDDDREAVVAQARQRNPQAFAPWTRDEEQEIRRRHEAGESIPAIARARKRSPRAIELRLRRLGVLPAEDDRRAG